MNGKEEKNVAFNDSIFLETSSNNNERLNHISLV